MITGTKVKKHKCLNNLQIHCEFCFDVSLKKSDFYKHANCFHLQEISKLWLKCNPCDHYYPTKSILNHHQQTAHRKSERIQCQFCPKMFLTDSAFKKHAHGQHQQPLADSNINLTAGTNVE
jgi:hypothetical protein